MHHSDVVRGIFMVFDAFLNGFAISEKYSFTRDEETKKLNAEVVEKIASFSNGIFHLVKGKGEDELWFIVGHIHEGLTELGYETIFFLIFLGV